VDELQATHGGVDPASRSLNPVLIDCELTSIANTRASSGMRKRRGGIIVTGCASPMPSLEWRAGPVRNHACFFPDPCLIVSLNSSIWARCIVSPSSVSEMTARIGLPFSNRVRVRTSVSSSFKSPVT
jgi:hypothetical protein